MCNKYNVSHRYTLYDIYATYMRIIRNSLVKQHLRCRRQTVSFKWTCKNFVNYEFQLSHRTSIAYGTKYGISR
jgi:hypothetical protein